VAWSEKGVRVFRVTICSPYSTTIYWAPFSPYTGWEGLLQLKGICERLWPSHASRLDSLVFPEYQERVCSLFEYGVPMKDASDHPGAVYFRVSSMGSEILQLVGLVHQFDQRHPTRNDVCDGNDVYDGQNYTPLYPEPEHPVDCKDDDTHYTDDTLSVGKKKSPDELWEDVLCDWVNARVLSAELRFLVMRTLYMLYESDDPHHPPGRENQENRERVLGEFEREKDAKLLQIKTHWQSSIVRAEKLRAEENDLGRMNKIQRLVGNLSQDKRRRVMEWLSSEASSH